MLPSIEYRKGIWEWDLDIYVHLCMYERAGSSVRAHFYTVFAEGLTGKATYSFQLVFFEPVSTEVSEVKL